MFCISKIKELKEKVKLVNVKFIKTEFSSKISKVLITIQTVIVNGIILHESLVVKFLVVTKICEDCIQTKTKQSSGFTKVQVRQHVKHKRTFLMLEQMIIKYGADSNCVQIKNRTEGIDFFYNKRSHCQSFIDFLQDTVPIRFRACDKRHLSHNTHTNSHSFQSCFSVEIAPVCKEDLICLPEQIRAKMGWIAPLLVCSRVTNLIQLVDPISLRFFHINSTQYWSNPFTPILYSEQLQTCIVLDLEQKQINKTQNHIMEVEIARYSDFGINNQTFILRTHLGKIIKIGDHVLGYDMTTANVTDPNYESIVSHGYRPQEIILACKSNKTENKHYKRLDSWKLRKLNISTNHSELPPMKTNCQIKGKTESQLFFREIEDELEIRC
jgi:nonsense-mediated mRNA decay protein 3